MISKESKREYDHAYYLAHKAHILSRNAQYRTAHPEKCSTLNRRWKQEHAAHVKNLAYVQFVQREQTKKVVAPTTPTAEQIIDVIIQREQRRSQYYTNKRKSLQSSGKGE